MEIVKKGDLDRLKKTRQFECKRCGCVFKAYKDEYEVKSEYNEIYFTCKCPTCGGSCYKDG